jgi:predicted helicase
MECGGLPPLSKSGSKLPHAISEWNAPFRPAGKGDYFDWPLLTDLMPWQHSGAQAKRTWPIGATQDVLERRWQQLLAASDRASAFKESRDRTIDKSVHALHGTDKLTPIQELDSNAQPENSVRYGFRSFDRQFILADNRICDYLRPELWRSHSNKQLYFATLFTQSLGPGSALTVSAEVPDLHFFSGRGAKDIVPFYRDAAAKAANLHPQLLAKLSKAYGQPVAPEDFAAYLYGLLAQPAFTARFAKELESRELRLPLTADAALFLRGAELGRELLYLHTYGERCAEGQRWPQPVIKCHKAVPAGGLPESFAYDAARKVIRISNGKNSGEFGPVAREVWDYEVSGLKVVQSWLGYRMKNRKGKKSSPLDDISPAEWESAATSEFLRLLNLLTRTLALHPQQEKLLEAVLNAPLLKASDFSPVPPEWRKAPAINTAQGALEV